MVCLFVCLWICFFFVLIILGHLQEVSLKVSWISDLISLRYIGSQKSLLVCLFFCFNHLGTHTGSYPENFMKIWLDLADIFMILKCLFVCLSICFFYFNHLGTPTGSYPENFVKIQLELAKIFRIFKMFICLFVCLFVYRFFCFISIIVGHPQEVSLKVLWRYYLVEIFRI